MNFDQFWTTVVRFVVACLFWSDLVILVIIDLESFGLSWSILVKYNRISSFMDVSDHV